MYSKQDSTDWDSSLLKNALSRFWDSTENPSVGEPSGMSNYLGWTLGCDWTQEETVSYSNLATQICIENFRYVLLIAVGGSSAGARAIVSLGDDRPQFIYVDSLVPDTVEKILNKVGNEKTLLIVSSKSGTTLETVTLAKYFLEKLSAILTMSCGSQNAIAITDPGTELETFALQHKFRSVVYGKINIGGRFSELSSFGLFPALLNKSDVASVVDAANNMVSLCHNLEYQQNPAASLSDYLGNNLAQSRDKLYVYLPSSMKNFDMWLEQLLSESLGKEGVGIIPIVGEPELLNPSKDVCAVIYEDLSDPDKSVFELRKKLEDYSIPTYEIQVDGPACIGGEFFKWKLSVVLLANLMDINPFDQPQVQNSKDMTNKILDHFVLEGELPVTSPTVSFYEWVSNITSSNYVAILPFVSIEDSERKLLSGLAIGISSLTGAHVTIASSPSYLHSTGQMHKGGPASGVFLQLLSTSSEEVPIRDENYGLSTLLSAQADGDLETLLSLGRSVCRVNLGPDINKGLRELVSDVKDIYLRK